MLSLKRNRYLPINQNKGLSNLEAVFPTRLEQNRKKAYDSQREAAKVTRSYIIKFCFEMLNDKQIFYIVLLF